MDVRKGNHERSESYSFLAYSGGLDTSVAISYLKERTGKDVVAVSLDVGQGGESLETIKQRALACGAVEAYVVDARETVANEYCMKALKANAMYEGVYPWASAISLSADFQAPCAKPPTSSALTPFPTAAPARATTRFVSRSPLPPSTRR